MSITLRDTKKFEGSVVGSGGLLGPAKPSSGGGGGGDSGFQRLDRLKYYKFSFGFLPVLPLYSSERLLHFDERPPRKQASNRQHGLTLARDRLGPRRAWQPSVSYPHHRPLFHRSIANVLLQP